MFGNNPVPGPESERLLNVCESRQEPISPHTSAV